MIVRLFYIGGIVDQSLSLFITYNSVTTTARKNCQEHKGYSCMLPTRVTRRAPLVEQELQTRPEHLSSSPVLIGIRVTRYICVCVMLCRSLFVLLSI